MNFRSLVVALLILGVTCFGLTEAYIRLRPQDFYPTIGWGMIPVLMVAIWAFDKTRASTWLDKQRVVVRMALVLAIIAPVMLLALYVSNMGLYHAYIDNCQNNIYGQTLVFYRYDDFATPENGAVIFHDKNGNEKRIGCCSHFREHDVVDLAYLRLQPGQRVRFGIGGIDENDPRPIPTVLPATFEAQ